MKEKNIYREEVLIWMSCEREGEREIDWVNLKDSTVAILTDAPALSSLTFTTESIYTFVIELKWQEFKLGSVYIRCEMKRRGPFLRCNQYNLRCGHVLYFYSWMTGQTLPKKGWWCKVPTKYEPLATVGRHKRRYTTLALLRHVRHISCVKKGN